MHLLSALCHSPTHPKLPLPSTFHLQDVATANLQVLIEASGTIAACAMLLHICGNGPEVCDSARQQCGFHAAIRDLVTLEN